MSAWPGWTRADEIEWRMLVDALVEEAWPHRGKPGFSAALGEALDVVLAWRRSRELETLACHLRAREDLNAARAA